MKAKIFVGGRESGKSRTANMIAEYVGIEKTAIFTGKQFNNNRWVFSEIKEDTQLIIIDDCPENFNYSRFFPVEDNRPYGGELKYKITREIPRQETQIIQVPYLIFTTNKLSKKWLEYGASFKGRFEIINFPLSNPSTLLTQKNGTTHNNADPGEVITKEHEDFKILMCAIDKELSVRGCDHKHSNFYIACKRLEEFRVYTIDREKTIQYLESKGGYCDCEIMMNVQYAE